MESKSMVLSSVYMAGGNSGWPRHGAAQRPVALQGNRNQQVSVHMVCAGGGHGAPGKRRRRSVMVLYMDHEKVKSIERGPCPRR